MSTGAENQRKLYDGYVRIAQQLGAVYEVFPFITSYPINIGYADVSLPVSIAADNSFTTPLKFNKPAWLAFMDGDLVQQFNFLVGPYGTFYIGDKQPFAPLQVVKCNKLISLGRVVYSTSGPVAETVVNYAEGIPAFFQFKRAEIQRQAGLAAQTLGRAITHWDAFIPGPQGFLQQDDVITEEDGTTYIIDAPNFTNMGYVCHVRLSSL
jgi:hypothetical protein